MRRFFEIREAVEEREYLGKWKGGRLKHEVASMCLSRMHRVVYRFEKIQISVTELTACFVHIQQTMVIPICDACS